MLDFLPFRICLKLVPKQKVRVPSFTLFPTIGAITYHLGAYPLCLCLVAVEEVAFDRELRAEVGAEVLPGLHHQEHLEGVLVGDPAHRTVAEGISQLAALAGEVSLALLVPGQRLQQVVQLGLFPGVVIEGPLLEGCFTQNRVILGNHLRKTQYFLYYILQTFEINL